MTKKWIKFLGVIFGTGGLVGSAVMIIQIFVAKPPQTNAKQGFVGCNFSGDVFFNEKEIVGKKHEEVGLNKARKSMVGVLVTRPDEIFGKKEFFLTEYGSLSILPDAQTRSSAANANTFWVLQPFKKNNVKLSRIPIWLQFNHHFPDSNKKIRHLGIFVVTFGQEESVKKLEIFRNKNWKRPQSNTTLGEFSNAYDLPWSEFYTFIKKYSSKDAKLAEMDLAIKGPWHAIPGGGDNFSWDYREFWKWAAERCESTAYNVLGESPDFDHAKVSTRLIRFTPISKPISNSPVIFDIRSISKENAVIFVAIYSLLDTGQDLSRWFWIIDE